MGYYAAKANNINELANAYFNWIKQSDWQEKPCNVTIDLPDEYDAEFEIYMHAISQDFNKIA